MVIQRECNIFNDISKFKRGDIVKIAIPCENFWTKIKTISKTTGNIVATIYSKLMTPYPIKTVKFKVKNILDVWKENKKITKKITKEK